MQKEVVSYCFMQIMLTGLRDNEKVKFIFE